MAMHMRISTPAAYLSSMSRQHLSLTFPAPRLKLVAASPQRPDLQSESVCMVVCTMPKGLAIA